MGGQERPGAGRWGGGGSGMEIGVSPHPPYQPGPIHAPRFFPGGCVRGREVVIIKLAERLLCATHCPG